MKRKKLLRGIFAWAFAMLLNIITVSQIQAAIVTYDAITNHLFAGRVLVGFTLVNPVPEIGEIGYEEYTYAPITNASVSWNTFSYDDSKYSLSFNSKNVDDPGLEWWVSDEKINYQWDGTFWSHVGSDVFTISTYNSYYTEKVPVLTPIPEPSMAMLMGLGIIGMGYAKRRQS